MDTMVITIMETMETTETTEAMETMVVIMNTFQLEPGLVSVLVLLLFLFALQLSDKKTKVKKDTLLSIIID